MWDDEDLWPAGFLEQFAHSTDQEAETSFGLAARQIAAMAKDDNKPMDVVEIPLSVRFVVSIPGVGVDDEVFASYAQQAWKRISAAMSAPGSNRFPAMLSVVAADPVCVFVISPICIGRQLSPASVSLVDDIVRANIGQAALHLALNTNVSRYGVREEDYGRFLRRLLFTTASPSRPVVEDVYLALHNLTTLQ